MKKYIIIITVLLIGANIYASDLETISPTITGNWDYTGGTITVPSPTANSDAATKKYVDDNSGDPDITGRITGDLFNSTSTFTGGIAGGIANESLTVASYDFYLGSTTANGTGFDFVVSTTNLQTNNFVEVERVPIPAGVSTHTATSSGYTIQADNGLWKIDIENVNEADPEGEPFNYAIKD